MALEIERKFLVVDQSFKGTATSVVDMRQGYLSRDADAVVRVRIAGDRAFLTVKTRNRGCVRNEFEYEVPVADADAMLSACRGFRRRIRSSLCLRLWERKLPESRNITILISICSLSDKIVLKVGMGG